jgi:tRNA U38,U39,U40 pseudouridine synthase TruA
VIGIEGSGFLWNMVRIIVGTLAQVGIGHYTPDDVVRMLEAKDRKSSGPTAPPHGLYLQWIKTKHKPPTPMEGSTAVVVQGLSGNGETNAA